MEKNRKISLSNLHRQELEKSCLAKIVGGDKVGGNCGCGCNGPSSTCDNAQANYSRGLASPGEKRLSCLVLTGETWTIYKHLAGLDCSIPQNK